MSGGSLAATTLLFMLCFAGLGAGNGALFQLVPLRWPLTTAVAGSMIGEVGALGGGFIPQRDGACPNSTAAATCGASSSFAVLALLMLVMLRVVQIRWTRTWAERGGRQPMGQHAAPQTPSERGSGMTNARSRAIAAGTSQKISRGVEAAETPSAIFHGAAGSRQQRPQVRRPGAGAALEREQHLLGGLETRACIERDHLEHQVIRPDQHISGRPREGGVGSRR